MDDKDKKSNINASSLVDLKAELLRKQEEFRRERLQHGNKSTGRKPLFKKESIWDRKNAGVLQRAQRDLEEKQEEENDLEKSRKALEAKAKLYEQMTNTSEIPEDESEPRFMVDFQKKVVDNIIEQRQVQRLKEEEAMRKKQEEYEKRRKEEEEIDEERQQLQKPFPNPENPDEEWVDYVDSFGRSRRCMKKDLPENGNEKIPVEEKGLLGMGRDLMSADMYREIMREKWEKEMEEAAKKPAGPVHYANVQFDEVRSHGVGYFQFSKEEQARQEQLEQLKNLREQTLDHRARAEKLKQKRKTILAARLAKVKQRRMINTDNLESEDKKDSDSDDDLIGPKLDEAATEVVGKEKEVEPLERDESLKKNTSFREWDKGKQVEPPNYYERRREERFDEFAPPSVYFDSRPKHRQSVAAPPKTSNRQLWHRSKEVNPESLFEENGVPVVEEPNPGPISQQTDTNNVTGIAPPLSGIKTVEEYVSQGLKELRQPYSMEPVSNIPITVEQIPLPPMISNLGSNMQENTGTGASRLASGVGHPVMLDDNISYIYKSENALLSGSSDSHHPSSQNVDLGLNSLSEKSSEPCNLVSLNYGYGTLEEAATSTQLTKNTSLKGEPVSFSSANDINSSVAAPQPAHYSRGPSKPQTVRAPRYEPVNIHKLPASLPAPPTSHNIPLYPSQEVIHGSKQTGPSKNKANVKNWMRQFNFKGGGETVSSNVMSSKIPFPSPYVQKKEGESEVFAKVDFDPSKPPPSTKEK